MSVGRWSAEVDAHRIDFPVIYTNARKRIAVNSPEEYESGKDLSLLFETILSKIPAPKIEEGGASYAHFQHQL